MNTTQMLTRLFPQTKNIPEIAKIIEKYSNFGVNTNLRLAHFLAQVREEVGEEFKPISESLNYSEKALIKYEIDKNTGEKVIKELFKNMTPELAEKYARDEDIPITDQVAIANIAYANRMGNGDMDTDKDGKLDEDDDGWKYRGAGVLQITGKDNYSEVQRRIDKYAPTSNIDIILSPKDIHTLEGSILAGLGFWIWKDLHKIADMGVTEANVDNITKKINLYTDSYINRKNHFNKIKDLIN